jgi:hypothetical protein
MNHAIAILKKEMDEATEECFDLSADGDAIGSEHKGYVASDCRKAIAILSEHSKPPQCP